MELVGPCLFGGWAKRPIVALGIAPGDPLGKENPEAWIQIAAVTVTQTRTTMLLFQSLFTDDCKSKHAIEVGKELVYAHHGQRQIQAVTSNPAPLEGARTTLSIQNETHNWVETNNGHAMREVIDRNATKLNGRVLSITNAYQPGESSVAQRIRESWEAQQAGTAFDTGFLYDSLEVSPQIGLRPATLPEDPALEERAVRDHLAKVIGVVSGGSYWLRADRIANSVLDPNNSAALSRRFWFNQIVADEESWADPAAVDAAIDDMARSARGMVGVDHLRSGWLVDPSEPIVMFGDMSKNNDTTGLVGCRISDGYTFVIGTWSKPTGEEGKGWQTPRGQVDARVAESFERFNVVAFWADPSHTTDDESAPYWTPTFDEWHRKYRDKLGDYWAAKGDVGRAHAVMWDMSSPERTKMFAIAAEQVQADLHEKDDLDRPTPTFRIDGNPVLITHLRNAKAYMTKNGHVSLSKESPSSNRKIDLAVCMVGAQMLRRHVLNAAPKEKKAAAGRFWGA